MLVVARPLLALAFMVSFIAIGVGAAFPADAGGSNGHGGSKLDGGLHCWSHKFFEGVEATLKLRLQRLARGRISPAAI